MSWLTSGLRPLFTHRLAPLAMFLAGGVAFALCVITPLPLPQQALLALSLIAICALLMRRRELWAKLTIGVAAALVATRYVYWRITETLEFRTLLEAVLGYGMIAAEIYLLGVLILSLFQTLQGRERKPAPLPLDPAQWPSVDVFIPTYNEPLDVVSTVVFAAQRMDYPAEKLRIHLLDDGRRPEFRAFAAEAGVNYVTRADNKHAKAGNLNNALKQTDAELVAIFDCDHVPTRGFLQLTVGWFMKDPKVGMLQTPHYFYSKDPFERNLAVGPKLSNEGLLFYGVVQDGNDFWNASFFCGSCAVLRRTALEEVGGIAVETVTEDAHTSLRMQRRGWKTAFLRRPLAAGLATGSLAAHIGQRMRWARGMLQIFRLDNPLFGPGLSPMQRLCYLNAITHFLFPLPRVVLLTAPLAFLLLGQQIIFASTLELLAYAAPYLIVATMASVRIQGRHRQPFWGEIYEAVLSLHLLRPTVMTLLQPRKGKFNVTSKVLTNEETVWDWSTMKTHAALLAVMLGAAGYGVYALLAADLPANVAATTAVNVVWALISATVLAVCVAIGLERRELRQTPRIAERLTVTVHLGDGRALAGETRDVSVDGAAIAVRLPTDPVLDNLGVELMDRSRRVYTPARLVAERNGTLRLRFEPDSIETRRALAAAVMGRTDAWKRWDAWEEGRVLGALGMIGASIGGLASWVGAQLAKPAGRRLAAAAAAVALAGLVLPAADAFAATAPEAGQSRGRQTITLSLDEFGVLAPIRLQGQSNTRGIGFSLRSDQVVTGARMAIPIAYSPNLDPTNSQLSVLLNGQIVQSVALNPVKGVTDTLEFDVNPYLFLRDNDLVFRMQGKRSGDQAQCVDDEMVWAQVSDQAQITLTVERLSLSPDLSHLPMPFFDRRDAAELKLPFVFSARPSLATIEAAGVVASYWGVEAAYRGATFPVRFDTMPSADAIAFVTPGETISALSLPEIKGPALAVIPNPMDETARILVVMGRNGEELMAAARALAIGANVLAGDFAPVEAPTLAPRAPYDAPRWIPTDRPVRLGELTEAGALEGRGISPGVLSANLRMAPDFFAWQERGVPMTVRFRHPGEQWIDLEKSRLDVLVNDKYVTSFSLRHNDGVGLLNLGARTPSDAQERQALIPPYLLFGQTNLQFYFDLHARSSGACIAEPGELRTAIDLDSEIDLRGLHRYTKMPNLAFLTQAGFPFTRMADLSETVAVISPDFEAADLEALFATLAMFGDRTGTAATRLKLAFPSEVDAYAERDILVVGSFARQPLFQAWAKHANVSIADEIATIRARSMIERAAGHFQGFFAGAGPVDSVRVPAKSLNGLVASFRSPLNPNRTVVMLGAPNPEGLPRVADALRSPQQSPRFQGDLVFVAGEQVTSYAVAETYYVGSLPPLKLMTWHVANTPWAMSAILGLSLSLVAAGSLAAIRRRSQANAREDGEPDAEAK